MSSDAVDQLALVACLRKSGRSPIESLDSWRAHLACFEALRRELLPKNATELAEWMVANFPSHEVITQTYITMAAALAVAALLMLMFFWTRQLREEEEFREKLKVQLSYLKSDAMQVPDPGL